MDPGEKTEHFSLGWMFSFLRNSLYPSELDMGSLKVTKAFFPSLGIISRFTLVYNKLDQYPVLVSGLDWLYLPTGGVQH